MSYIPPPTDPITASGPSSYGINPVTSSFSPATSVDTITGNQVEVMTPGQLVTDGWQQAQVYADSAFTEAKTYLGRISDLTDQIADVPAINIDIPAQDWTITPITMPATPERPLGMEANMPAVPVEPIIGTVEPLNVGNAPEFSDSPPSINLDLLEPELLNAELPLSPDLNAIILPTAPVITLPEMSALMAITLPDVPTINLPVWATTLEAAPVMPNLGEYAFTEERYTSDLLSNLRARLLEWVNGDSTGLDPDVERAIWNRAREREAGAMQRASREAIRGFAARGFSRPPGALAVALAEAAQAIQSKDADLSREIMVKQAELEQSNRKFAFEQAWQVENGLITYSSQIAQRAFEVSKFAIEISVEAFKAQLLGFSAQVEAFKARALVFESQLKAELAYLEIYKAQLDGQKLIGDLNLQAVEIYKARIAALEMRASLFKTEVEAAVAASTVNKNLVDAFSARVMAYKTTVDAKSAEYEGYATRIKAQVSKAEVYNAMVGAYKGRVDGFRALVDAKVAEKSAEIKTNIEVPMDLFKARTEIFRTGVGAEGERIRALAGVYATDAQVFSADVSAQATRTQSEAGVAKAEADVQIGRANLQIEAAKANIQKVVSQVGLISEGVRAGAQVSAQLASAALSAVNLSGGISQNASYGYSESRSDSTSQNVSSSISDSSVTSNSNSASFSVVISKSID